MRIFAITSAFCNAAQLANSLMRFYKHGTPGLTYRHIVVWGHYPLRTEENERNCRMIAAAAGVEWMDPGQDLGSAQTQNWCIGQLDLQENDVILTHDPDSFCTVSGWDEAMLKVMQGDPQCALVHTMSPPVQDMIKKGRTLISIKKVDGVKLAIPQVPDQFNITMWRYSTLKQLGGILQMHPFYGQVEIPMWEGVRKLGQYNAYMTDFMEDESAKVMHDDEFQQWKIEMAHTFTFKNKFGEYIKLKYPHLAK